MNEAASAIVSSLAPVLRAGWSSKGRRRLGVIHACSDDDPSRRSLCGLPVSQFGEPLAAATDVKCVRCLRFRLVWLLTPSNLPPIHIPES